MRRFLLLLLAAAAAHGQNYTFFESEHFELLTDGSKGRAQDILAQFERVRAFFVKARGFRDPVLKPRIVVFASGKEFREYAPNAAAAAFYISLPQRDYIAIGPSTNTEDKRIAVHEYVHLLNRYGDTDLPVWMNEGLAELYSNIEPAGSQIRVGAPIAHHVFAVNQQWLPLEDIVGAGHTSPLYNRRQHSGPFYGISWALAHMLSLDPRYSGKFRALYAALGAGKPAKQALEEVYAKPLSQIEADLRSYMRGNSVNVVMYEMRFDKVDKVTPRQASRYDWIVGMAALKQGNRDTDGALQRLEAMVKAEPGRAEAHEAMAFVHMMDRSSKAAAAAFAAARKAGSRNPNLFYWAPSMGNDYNVSIEALQQTVAAHPDFTAARLRLATMLLAVRQPQEAYDVLKQLKKVDQKQALEYFPVYIRAAWTLKKIEEARAAASQFVKTARAERDKDRAKEMFAFAMEDPPAEEEKLAARAALPERETNFEVDTTELTVPEDSNLEVVRENGQVSVRAKPLSFVEGMMVLLECDQPQPIANVKTKEGTVVRLIIDEPGNVHLVNAKTGSGDLVCGQQSNNVRLGYYPKDGPGTRTAGSIRRFEYLP